MNASEVSNERRILQANALGIEVVRRLVAAAAPEAGVGPEVTSRLLAAARKESRVRRPVVLDALPDAQGGHAGSTEQDGLDYALVRPPTPGRFNPTVIQLKLSPLIASACGAVGSVLGSLSPLGWALVAVAAAIALRDFWNKKAHFDGVHGQFLFELYRSTEDGKNHAVPVAHLRANLDASRAEAKEPPLSQAEFDQALAMLVGMGVVGFSSAGNALHWTEMSVEMPAP